MKRSVLAGILLLSLVALPLHAFRIASVDEVIRLHRAGVSEELIEAFLEAAEPFEVTAEDVVAMEEAGLSAQLIDAVVAAGEGEPASFLEESGTTNEPEPDEAEAIASQQGDWCRTFDPPVEVFIAQHFFPPWLWDPFWYMPRFDSRIASGPDPRVERTRDAGSGHVSPPAGRPRAERERPESARPHDSEKAGLESPKRRPANINTSIAPPRSGASPSDRLPEVSLRPNL